VLRCCSGSRSEIRIPSDQSFEMDKHHSARQIRKMLMAPTLMLKKVIFQNTANFFSCKKVSLVTFMIFLDTRHAKV
jgi:hypothetical protein